MTFVKVAINEERFRVKGSKALRSNLIPAAVFCRKFHMSL
jgi:hypothetical protein